MIDRIESDAMRPCSKEASQSPGESDSVKSEARLQLQICAHAAGTSPYHQCPVPGLTAELIRVGVHGEHRALRRPRPRLPPPGTPPLRLS